MEAGLGHNGMCCPMDSSVKLISDHSVLAALPAGSAAAALMMIAAAVTVPWVLNS